ncbi:hypothetical protein [uncultured Paludibaculum sp.]|uniref:hypothetical protein n=1 Tax=uncultured Paludibaculum sp. TaxID=1765020 RepID=UPI002AAC1E89|nr:hypothetical protein [uncultured Paludibaculum sp.]
MKLITRILPVFALAALFLGAGVSSAADANNMHTTSAFQGSKANTGMAVHSRDGNKSVLKVTADFKVPDTPAPTWRVVDNKGNIYTLDAFKIKGGEKREVVVPNYVPNVAKVQVYCAFAEVLLGEASFPSPVK